MATNKKINYRFLIAASAVFVVIIVALGLYFYVLYNPTPSPEKAAEFLGLLENVIFTGFGAFVGLLGGKQL